MCVVVFVVVRGLAHWRAACRAAGCQGLNRAASEVRFRGENTRLKGEFFEQIERLKYLGSFITQDGSCVEDIRGRIKMAKDAFQKTKSLVTNTALSLSLRMRSIKSFTSSTLFYRCEA